MSKTKLFLALIVIGIVGYFGFPYFQEYYLYNKAWGEPTITAVDEYLDAFPENDRGEQLMTRLDEYQIKELLEPCDTTIQSEPASQDGDCCLHLRWYIKKGRPMFESKRYRAALDSCVFYSNAHRSDYERVKIYYQTIGKGDFSDEINRLAASLTAAERLSTLQSPHEEASNVQELVNYLRGKRFSETVPIFFDRRFYWPKAYTDYDPFARQLLEEAYLANSDYYLNGKQPEAADFERVNNPIWSFIVEDRDKNELARQVADHLQRYVGGGRLKLKEPKGPPLDRPRIELYYKLQNSEDTIAGMVVPVLSVMSSSEYNSQSGLKESFTGYSLTPELFITLKYYPEEPEMKPFIYYGRGEVDDEIRTIGSDTSLDLIQKTSKSTFKNAINDVLKHI